MAQEKLTIEIFESPPPGGVLAAIGKPRTGASHDPNSLIHVLDKSNRLFLHDFFTEAALNPLHLAL